jgi:hypothetical protein
LDRSGRVETTTTTTRGRARERDGRTEETTDDDLARVVAVV